MAEKKTGKLALLNRAIMAKAATLKKDDTFSLGMVAGVSNKYKLKHSDTGTGVVLFGEFVVRTEDAPAEGKEKTFSERSAQAIILPMDLGSKIAKKLKQAKNQVKFCLSATVKGSDLMVSGYTVAVEWIQEPVELAQIDFVRDMMQEG